ncbi:MAG: ABC transporter ATP-binding protein/permease [Bacilli bacterium]|nr:ABC transporter ATP-binding protein/permease [Bacilli bacterium]
MIKLENVNKYFNHHKKNEIHVINNTSLDLPEKGLVALLGPSGCGKTTLLNVVGGLDKVKSGKIYVNGKRITKRTMHYVDKVRNLNVGYIFQNYYLVDNMSVYDNVALSLKMIGIKDKEEIRKRVSFILETMGIYLYRNRPANMLSGGERQRVGIARAIVKNPNIIIADEPTGNLDSGNTIEIMNIIKSISKERLVILVTHENDLAKFYADRILEIEDGVITKDYINKNNENLDYRQDNKFYLKDFKHISHFENEDNEINIYNDLKNDIKLQIVVKDNNIYIKGGKNQKIEVVDNDSNIEFINDHYKQIDKSVYEKYEFAFSKIIDETKKKRYSSILNPFTLIINGFKKLLDYSFIKKILLLGFLGSGAFVTYAVSNAFGITRIEDKYFVSQPKEYYKVSTGMLKYDDYLRYEKIESVDYLIPGKGEVTLQMPVDDFYQSYGRSIGFSGVLISNKYLKEEDLTEGRLPENDYEIVLDELVLNNLVKKHTKNVGIIKNKDFIGRTVKINNMPDFKIVGIASLTNRGIYTSEKLFINMLANTKDNDDEDYYYYEKLTMEEETINFLDYNLVENINLKKGRLPENDYEVILPISKEGEYTLNKQIKEKINDTKLTVVGFYDNNNVSSYLVNSNTIKINLITTSKNIIVMPKDENRIIDDFNNENLNIISTYDEAKQAYQNERKAIIKAGMTVCIIILGISFVEIYLMIRASFLSRIKEIGIYRAIGVKRIDIYKMFFGEIFAITTIACVPGSLFTSYALHSLNVISYFAENYMVNLFTIILSIILIYAFNLFVGLLPVIMVVKDPPAKILARKDID